MLWELICTASTSRCNSNGYPQHICLYTEVDKKYTGCNLKATELLDCAFIGVCAVIRSNMVIIKESHYLASVSLQGLIKFSFQGVTNFFGCSVLVLRKA